MVDRRKQNIGHPWKTEGDRRNVNMPVKLIPVVKLIAYTLDKEGYNDDSVLQIEEEDHQIVIRLIRK